MRAKKTVAKKHIYPIRGSGYLSDTVASSSSSSSTSVLALAADDTLLLTGGDPGSPFGGGDRLRVSVRRRWDAVEDRYKYKENSFCGKCLILLVFLVGTWRSTSFG